MIRTVFLASSNPVTGTGGASKVISAYYDFIARLNENPNNRVKYVVKPVIFHDCAFSYVWMRYIPAITSFLLPFRLWHAFANRKRDTIKPILWWHSFGIIDIIILSILCIFIPARTSLVVVTLHNPFFLDTPHSLLSKVYMYFVILSKAKIHYLNSSYILDISPNAQVSHTCPHPSYISINPLPNNLLKLINQHLSSPVSGKLHKHPKHIFTMCQLVSGKQVDHLLNAFALLPSDWTLSIAGKGSECDNLLKLCARLNVLDRTNFLGFIGDAEKEFIFSRSSVFCVPSISDTQSLVNIEAIAHGLPLALYPYKPFINLYSKYPSVYFSSSFSPASLAECLVEADGCPQYKLLDSQSRVLSDFGDNAILQNFGPDIFPFPAIENLPSSF
jgi:glycosyltransferase involved in cell wall biosynthesis